MGRQYEYACRYSAARARSAAAAAAHPHGDILRLPGSGGAAYRSSKSRVQVCRFSRQLSST
jgi:hypothetical protein